MFVAGFAMHAHTCYIYIRGEYYNESSNLQKAIDEAYEANLIGKNASGSGWDFDIFYIEVLELIFVEKKQLLLESLEGKKGSAKIKTSFSCRSRFIWMSNNCN